MTANDAPTLSDAEEALTCLFTKSFHASPSILFHVDVQLEVSHQTVSAVVSALRLLELAFQVAHLVVSFLSAGHRCTELAELGGLRSFCDQSLVATVTELPVACLVVEGVGEECVKMKEGFAMRILWELEDNANEEDGLEMVVEQDEIPRRGRVPNQIGEQGITNVKRGW